ncbi:MAG TPA: sigma-54 dependent transcriptional regulator [Tenuifilaceae bacterium]|nr:sigma-54 dependent transcriptional regulator [Tenuifilaceae bacterium]HPE19565.1 sigma-54 dependent transcriptional regulator [Tenuifilaceae bacterium]HPJ46739.1 sigma-54 dependent transcriptional regulator [Tenuifilaceae bacterium]HPQ33262.1 sigma-54 dependent transcriptional regulator [Tenuifilaceae bacterium]HRX69411.1 sigma-54 dependent transcriptional regulator [Tenuifilaceae bacterium]
MESINILVLDDEKVFRDEIREFLENDGFTVFSSGLPSEAFKILEKQEVDILILDLRLPETDGFSVLDKVKRLYPHIEVIMITGHGDMDAVIQAMRLGAMEFFPKPFRLMDMKAAIKRTRRFVELSHTLKEMNQSLELVSKELRNNVGYEIVGRSKPIQKVIELMRKVAQADATSVLITGESGTGKELVARGIHYLSERKSSYFHAVNCSAIPDSLFESEFFGHKKGSYTGALEDKAGWFEIANGGTLFLDEIVDMQQPMQSKLLRVLEDRKIRRLGATSDITVDVRIIAATNQNIQELLENGKFRNDLYFRLNSFEIYIPPLRERPEDIPLLFDYYIDLFNQKLNKKVTGYDDNVLNAAMAYAFPGNIRELRNMIERAIILCDGDRLTIKEFSLPGISSSSQMVYENLPEKETFDLEEIEKRTIVKALEETGFKKTETAQLLNITRQSLDRRLEKYGLQF